MSDQNGTMRKKLMLLAGVLASGILILPAGAQSPAPGATPTQAATPTTPTTQAKATGAPYRFRPSHSMKQEEMYYASMWGVDSLNVKLVESGEIVRFAYRILYPDLAQPLNDKTLEPALIDPEAGVSLVVPAMDQVGLLRQSSRNPEPGKIYWMAFSNAGRRVKRGDRVVVKIGHFQAVGLVVE